MTRFLPIILLIIFQSAPLLSKGFELRYKMEEGGIEYRFKTHYKVKFTSLDEVRNLDEKISGTFEDQLLKPLENGGFRVSRDIKVQQYIHNGKSEPVKDYERNLAGYEYVLDPRKGKVRIVGNNTFDPDDALEMVVPFPRKSLDVGDTWRTFYHYSLSVGSKKRISLQGAFKLADIRGNIARIVGRFRAEIPKDPELDYGGSIKLDSEYYFHLSRGTIERGKVVTSLIYQSKSLIAREFFRQSQRKERLGYALHLTNSFERN
jgi:hypothetical protein